MENINYSQNNKKELQEMYDNIARQAEVSSDRLQKEDIFSMDKFPTATKYFYSRKLSEAFKLSGIKPGESILEVGCSSGYISFILVGLGYKVTAVDLSGKCIEIANTIKKARNVNNINFFMADAEDLSQFPDNHFDAVISFSTIRYLPNPQEALRHIHRVLKKGAVAVIDFPNKYCPWFKFLKSAFGIKEHIHDHLYSPGQVKNLFSQTGFKDIKLKPFLYIYKKLPLWLFYLMRAAGSILERIPVINLTAGIIMCSGKK